VVVAITAGAAIMALAIIVPVDHLGLAITAALATTG